MDEGILSLLVSSFSSSERLSVVEDEEAVIDHLRLASEEETVTPRSYKGIREARDSEIFLHFSPEPFFTLLDIRPKNPGGTESETVTNVTDCENPSMMSRDKFLK